MKQLVNTLLASAILLSAFTFNSCKKDNNTVDQDKIWAYYEVYYDKNQDKTFARTTFKFGNALGANLQLSAPATITFNGDVLTFQEALGYYEKQYASFISGGTFNYTDKNSITYSNSISNIRPITFPTIDTIHTVSSSTITWIGDSLTANESVNLWLNGSNQNNTAFFYQNTLYSHSIICAANQLQHLGNGNGTASMERVYAPAIQHTTSAGGEIKGKYKAHNITPIIAN